MNLMIISVECTFSPKHKRSLNLKPGSRTPCLVSSRPSDHRTIRASSHAAASSGFSLSEDCSPSTAAQVQSLAGRARAWKQAKSEGFPRERLNSFNAVLAEVHTSNCLIECTLQLMHELPSLDSPRQKLTAVATPNVTHFQIVVCLHKQFTIAALSPPKQKMLPRLHTRTIEM